MKQRNNSLFVSSLIVIGFIAALEQPLVGAMFFVAAAVVYIL